MQHHRHTVKITLRASDHIALQSLKNEPSLRVMVFCAAEKDGQQEIAFPHQSEIKVNTGEVKANLRGLKNKPGSTRPVDITKELRCTPILYSNAIEMTYALTTKVAPGTSHVRCQILPFPLPLYSLESPNSQSAVRTEIGNWPVEMPLKLLPVLTAPRELTVSCIVIERAPAKSIIEILFDMLPSEISACFAVTCTSQSWPEDHRAVCIE
jgi:hypothetical protein